MRLLNLHLLYSRTFCKCNLVLLGYPGGLCMIQDKIWIQKLEMELKKDFPGLQTEIGQPEDYKYVIHCKNYHEIFDKISETLEKYRMLGFYVKITKDGLSSSEKRIESLEMNNLSNCLMGNLVTNRDILVYLASRFHDVNILGMQEHPGIDFYIIIYVGKNCTDTQTKIIRDELLRMGIGTDDLRFLHVNELPDGAHSIDDAAHAKYDEIHLNSNPEFPFMRKEDDFWYDNFNKIYTGHIKKGDIPFITDGKTKCFFDSTYFDNINLRNGLLLYDEIYVGLPLRSYINNFYESQNIKRNELLELVEMGRVKVVLKDNEQNYDKSLLLEIGRLNDNAIIGRRGLNSLLAVFLTELSLAHERRNPSASDIAGKLYHLGVEMDSAFAICLAHLMAWPLNAKQDSINLFVNGGPMSLGSLRIEKIFSPAVENKAIRERMQEEYEINSLAALIASALDATYFPFVHDGKYSDAAISSSVGTLFKFYRYNFNTFRKISDGFPIDGEYDLRLLQINDMNVLKFNELTQTENITGKFKSLLKKLSDMEREQQKSAIQKYNDILFDFAMQSRKITVNKFDLALGIVSLCSVLPSVITFLAGLMGVAKTMRIFKDRSADIKLRNILEGYNAGDENIDADEIRLLDYISPAVRLRSI